MKRLALALALVCTAATAAWAEPAHSPPQGPAGIFFAKDVPAMTDHEWGFRLGGFGGIKKGAALHHVPVIFVHGNNVDAADWYPVRDDFHAAGWTDQELWALSYNGLGANNGIALTRTNEAAMKEHSDEGWDGNVRVTNDAVNVADLTDLIHTVQAYTGQSRFTLVSHSLGVTLARETLRQHPELRADLVAFVGIAGGNHGTSLCPPGSEGQVVSCDEIAAGTAWLARLNAAGETYAPARWMTVYDGSGAADPAFAGTYAQSPALAGADNRQYPGTYHNDLRVDAPIVADYRSFIETAEKPYLAGLGALPVAATRPAAAAPVARPGRTATTDSTTPGPVVRAPSRGLAATGGSTAGLGVLVLAAGAGLALRRRARTRGAS